ncbi:MAG: segregation ATPase FtsK/SpoIIIE, family, partial [Streptomyces sp.]|nr:segregation ATPase FtsK/SpoIIIE, family [Streptomyces sp.]
HVSGADLVLVIDNWAALRTAVEEADPLVNDISSRGLRVGVHLLLTANRWGEIRTNLRDNIGGRLELRLNETAESEISRQAAKLLRGVVAGHGIAPPGELMHIALPRLDSVQSAEELARAQTDAIEELASCWQRPAAPELRVLPERVTALELAAAVLKSQEAAASASTLGTPTAPRPNEVPIGIREFDLTPVCVELSGGDSHFVVFGDSGSGKTSFLRSWMAGLAARQSPWEIRFMTVDYRRSLIETVPDEFLGAQAANAEHAEAYVAQLVQKLRERMPPPGISSRELKARNWWSGPELYVVVDDYDLVTGQQGGRTSPLAPLAEYLTHAADIGLHLVLTRRTTGAARSLMSDPLVSRLQEFGTGGLILSGDPREGTLLGDQRAARRVPGRGVLISRGAGPQIVQTVLNPSLDQG